ncbi:MAG: HAMP domain-containing methyl-accepting chemotaxis protein, partial [Leptolyngbyaceae cyanobacterium bins.302]|nr:HAMP domain-containing methyl-accepting chemotaxis protein [Leptolyngbyaceae cyanobacterium bins.302]
QKLAQFAQTLGTGTIQARLPRTDRRDEIGILARELNEMAASIAANLEAVQKQEELRRQEAEQQRQEKEHLQRGVVNLLLEIEGAQQGDLTVKAPVTDGAIGSIADAFNATIRSLRQLVFQMRSVSGQVNDLALGSAPSVQQLSDAAKVQAQEIKQSLMSVSQINEAIQQIAQSAQEAAKIAQQGAQTAVAGEEVMDLTVNSMGNIQNAVAQTAQRVDRLTESFAQISQILTVISGIAERTNLLAYNASIEASRAGESGQGFRVVAEEVRRLAQRATDATKNIETIVETIQRDVVEVRQAMDLGTSEVHAGTELVDKTRQTLQELADIAEQIDQYLQSISQTTTLQANVSQRVNLTMKQVATITQTTSHEAQEVATSLQELIQVAQSLQNSVSQFRLEQ